MVRMRKGVGKFSALLTGQPRVGTVDGIKSFGTVQVLVENRQPTSLEDT
jgi:hypothetical protein